MARVSYPQMIGGRITQSSITPAFILSARVLDVNVDRYTVTIAPEAIKSPHSEIPFATPYQHHNNGEGIYFMPEVGSLCWVCYNSEGGRPFVLSWKAAMDPSGSFRTNKQSLNPGDIYLGTRDENFMVLRRGGVAQIGAGPLAQTIYLPLNNTIKHFCENYGLHSIGGDLEWTVRRTEETTDGARPSSLKLSAKQFANDPNPIAELEIGSQESDSDTILRLVIRDSGADGASDKVNLSLKKTGEVTWVAQGDVSGRSEGAYTVSSGGDMAFSSDGGLTAAAKGSLGLSGSDMSLNAESGAIELTAASTISLQAPTMIQGGTYPVMLASPDFLAWLMTHTHLFAGAVAGLACSGTTAPPLPAPPGSMVSKALTSD